MDAKLDDPTAVAVDSHGNVFIADTGNNRVREVLVAAPSRRSQETAPVNWCGRRAMVYRGPGIPWTPGVAVDRNGNLYISDTGHHEVRVVKPSGVMSDFAGNGVLGSGGNGGRDTGGAGRARGTGS